MGQVPVTPLLPPPSPSLTKQKTNQLKSTQKSKSQQKYSLFSACRRLFAELGCLPTRRDPDPLDECSNDTVSTGYSLSICPMSSISILDVGGVGNPSLQSITETGNAVPITSIPDITEIKDAAPTENNNTNTLNETSRAEGETNPREDLSLAQPSRLIERRDVQLEAPNDSSVSITSQALPPLPLVNFTCSFPTTIPPTVPHPVFTTVPTIFPTTVPTTADTLVNTTVNTEVPTEVLSAVANTVANTVPITVDTIVSTTAENTVDTTLDESDLPPADDKQPFLSIIVETTIVDVSDLSLDDEKSLPITVETTTVDESNPSTADDKQHFLLMKMEATTVETTLDTRVDESNLSPTEEEQPSFPYTTYNFTNSGLVVSEISGTDVEEQYHNTMEIIGEACGKCPKCTSDNRAQDLIDTIIELQFPDLDSALFRDGILSEFGFDTYWNELMVTKLEFRERHKKYENWYAKVWEDIEANNELPLISKNIEKEFAQSQEFRRILAGKQHPKSEWQKMKLLLFVIRMRRIRRKLKDRPQTQGKQEMQTTETTAKKNRKTRDQEKRRKLRDQEDKVAAKLLHDIPKVLKMVTVEKMVRNGMMALGKSTPFAKVCPPGEISPVWEGGTVLLPFINIQLFVSLMNLS
ncbi:uncharacterized protein EAE97_000990 [Botrytis byssoidea]|uniref:Uncharacterized protein n=1 Tax=Botrytis byssoidea TaxID=139641 RepID=A0A9P5ITL3_9HELO|nr:uncharacterized protein EAE97_000990 [Botrytis byssoidea]KAF7953591.1 hypothetical protein EAE97_000990 [Botrytis byssoidea]